MAYQVVVTAQAPEGPRCDVPRPNPGLRRLRNPGSRCRSSRTAAGTGCFWHSQLVIQPKKVAKNRLPILIDVKSAGDFTNARRLGDIGVIVDSFRDLRGAAGPERGHALLTAVSADDPGS